MTTEEADLVQHARHVDTIAAAVAKLFVRFGPQGLSPEALFEGAVKGGAVAIMTARELDAWEVAALLEDLADAFRDGGGSDEPAAKH
jgi:hypothetical protein